MRLTKVPPLLGCSNAILLAIGLSLIAGCQPSGTASCNTSGGPQVAKTMPKAERVARAQRFLAAGKSYPLGSDDFVCDVLEINYESANALLGDKPVYLGTGSGISATLVPGDVVGWKHFGSTGDPDDGGHVAIFLGSGRFIDVAHPGEAPETVPGFGLQTVYKSSNY